MLGNDVPVICHNATTANGLCRICVVDVNVVACCNRRVGQPVRNGAKVETNNERVSAAIALFWKC
jgi:NADH dehydrogenase/NADH:ubiquinone oxidoreductase subunit G